MEKKGNLFTETYKALITPDTAFSEGSVFTVPRIAVLALIIVAVTAGAILSLTFHQNETMRTLTIEESTRRIERMMASAPEEARQEAYRRANEQLNRQGLSFQIVFGVIFGAGIWLIVLVEAWFLAIILLQFLGGEEQSLDEKKHRRSFYLASYALIPLALQELIKGVILVFKDPAEIGNVLTLAEYGEATEVSLSLLSLFDLSELPGIIEYLVYNLTNPFFLWALVVGLFGGVAIYRVKAGKMSIALAVIVVLFGLQAQLLNLIQGGFGG